MFRLAFKPTFLLRYVCVCVCVHVCVRVLVRGEDHSFSHCVAWNLRCSCLLFMAAVVAAVLVAEPQQLMQLETGFDTLTWQIDGVPQAASLNE